MGPPANSLKARGGILMFIDAAGKCGVAVGHDDRGLAHSFHETSHGVGGSLSKVND